MFGSHISKGRWLKNVIDILRNNYNLQKQMSSGWMDSKLTGNKIAILSKNLAVTKHCSPEDSTQKRLTLEGIDEDVNAHWQSRRHRIH